MTAVDITYTRIALMPLLGPISQYIHSRVFEVLQLALSTIFDLENLPSWNTKE